MFLVPHCLCLLKQGSSLVRRPAAVRVSPARGADGWPTGTALSLFAAHCPADYSLHPLAHIHWRLRIQQGYESTGADTAAQWHSGTAQRLTHSALARAFRRSAVPPRHDAVSAASEGQGGSGVHSGKFDTTDHLVRRLQKESRGQTNSHTETALHRAHCLRNDSPKLSAAALHSFCCHSASAASAASS